MRLSILLASLLLGVCAHAAAQGTRDYAKSMIPLWQPPAKVAAGGWGGGSCDSGIGSTSGGYGGFNYGGQGGYGGYGGQPGGYDYSGYGDAGGSEGCQYPGNCAIHGCGSGGSGTRNRGGVVTSPVPPATQQRDGPTITITAPPPPPQTQPATQPPVQPPVQPPLTKPPLTTVPPTTNPPVTTGGPVDASGFPILQPPTATDDLARRLLDLEKKRAELEALLTQQGKPRQDTAGAPSIEELSKKLDATHQAVVQLGEQVKKSSNLKLTVQAAANLPPSYVDVSTIWAVQRRSKVSHMVLVADSTSKEWTTLNTALRTANSKFPVIQLLDVATDNVRVEPTPQLVTYYTDGRQPDVVSGGSVVLEKLRNVLE